MTDIKALVAEMEQALALSYPRIPSLGQFTPIAFWQDIFPELKRLWAVEQECDELCEAICNIPATTKEAAARFHEILCEQLGAGEA